MGDEAYVLHIDALWAIADDNYLVTVKCLSNK